MPSFKVRHVRDSGGGVKAVITAEALTIKEHGGEDWQRAGSGDETEPQPEVGSGWPDIWDPETPHG